MSKPILVPNLQPHYSDHNTCMHAFTHTHTDRSRCAEKGRGLQQMVANDSSTSRGAFQLPFAGTSAFDARFTGPPSQAVVLPEQTFGSQFGSQPKL